MMKMITFAILLLALLTLQVESTQRAELTIHEGPATFKETVVTDDKGEIEIIRTPAHNGRSAEVVLKNFKKGYRIIKFPAEKMCLVTTLSKDDEKPLELVNSAKKVKGVLPMSEYTVKNEELLPNGPADLKSDGGKMAQKFCSKGYKIESALAYTGNDLNGFVNGMVLKAMDEKEKSNEPEKSDELQFLEDEIMAEEKDAEATQSKPAADTIIEKRSSLRGFNFRTCKKLPAYATQITQCPDDIHYDCKVRVPRGCTYQVMCNSEGDCKSDHKFSSVVCCDLVC